MPKSLELIGMTFGKLTARESIKREGDAHLYYRCSCSCGGEKTTRATTLKQGRVKSCGCIGNGDRRALGKGEAALNVLYRRYQRDARDRGHSFNLPREEFKNLTSSDCAYCGVQPVQVSDRKGFNGKYLYNGIDRKDNSLGYTLDNVVPCCRMCNKAKGTMDENLFLSWIDRLVNYRKGT